MALLKTYYKSIFSFLVVAILIGHSGIDASISISLKTPHTVSWVVKKQITTNRCTAYLTFVSKTFERYQKLNISFLKQAFYKTKLTSITYNLQKHVYTSIKHQLEQSIALQGVFFNTKINNSISYLG